MHAISAQTPTLFTSLPPLPSSRTRHLPLRPSPLCFDPNPRLISPCPATQKTRESFGICCPIIKECRAEFFDDEWQAKQREKTKKWHAYRKKEEDEENRREDEYREIGMRLKDYPEEELCKARRLVSSFIRSAEEVEEKIEEAADKGELTELVLMIIWNRLDLARRDDEKDVIRSLDLLYRRIETEILKRESSPAMRLLNELLNLHDGFDHEGWLKKCRKQMIDTFPREDPFSMLVPAGFDIENHQSRIELPPEDDDVLLRVDFVREVDALLQEVRAEQSNLQTPEGFDPDSVAVRLKQQEKQQTIHLVMDLLELAVTLEW
ncbi:protein PALE CRESS, chloroplastic [Asparagus officinalis]|uniref:protein PALE CRESS, chloroplastic n=1 Tax=Asparagus officinalis TaxID=4686 RepID=UPI00098E8540|nr:protein PALE CRESS, chloroplastic [Asparagus officinalis]